MKKPGTVHATYLVSGHQREQHTSSTNGLPSQESVSDANLPSSPFPSSSAPQHQNEREDTPSIRVICLVKEEDLDQAKSLLNEVDSLHIYSIEPGTISDLHILTDCNRRVVAEYNEDPLQAWKQYGTIQNSHVKRRTQRRAPAASNAPTSTAAKPQPQAAPAIKTETSKPTAHKATKPTEDATAAKETAQVATGPAVTRPSNTNKPATLKREGSSIFKSFAKAKPKATKTESQPSVEPSPAQDAAILSDEDADEDSMMLDVEPARESAHPTKKDREAELRSMMEAEDEPMEDVGTPSAEADPEPDHVTEEPKEEPKEEVTVTDGRRRGRRRIMKKRTMKDEEGYLGLCGFIHQ